MGLFKRDRRQRSSGELFEGRFGPGELAASLRPFVMPPDRFPPGAAEGAPAALPGLVAAVAVWTGDGQVDFVPPAAMAELGGIRTVLVAAMANVENLDGLQVVREAVVGSPTRHRMASRSTRRTCSARSCSDRHRAASVWAGRMTQRGDR
jgi:hypothetical protein